jgi:hypothetical protein
MNYDVCGSGFALSVLTDMPHKVFKEPEEIDFSIFEDGNVFKDQEVSDGQG